MATRFYLPSDTTPPTFPPLPFVAPPYASGWHGFSQPLSLYRRRTRTVKANTAFETENPGLFLVGTYDIGLRQYVSDPLAAVSIVNPSIKWQIRAQELAAADALFTAIAIRVVDRWGSTRGTILGVTRDDTELVVAPTALTNRAFTSSPAVSFVAQNHDRLVIEVGIGGFISNFSGFETRFGDPTASADLPEDDSTTTDLVPWVEFSTDFQFDPPPDIAAAVRNSLDIIRAPDRVISY